MPAQKLPTKRILQNEIAQKDRRQVDLKEQIEGAFVLEELVDEGPRQGQHHDDEQTVRNQREIVQNEIAAQSEEVA